DRAVERDGEYGREGAAPPHAALLVARVAMVRADFVPLHTGEMVADDDVRIEINGVPRGQALQRVVGLVVCVLEIVRPALQLHVDGAPERGGSVHVIARVARRAETLLVKRARVFIGPLRE